MVAIFLGPAEPKNQPQNKSSTQTLPTSPKLPSKTKILPVQKPKKINPPKNIIINEILFNPAGGDAGQEFIELYNPNDIMVDLTGWSLRILATGGSGTSLAKIGGGKADLTSIKNHGFFLIGFNGYSASPNADVKRSAPLPNDGAVIYLVNPEGANVGTVAYTKSTPEGNSLERESPESLLFLDEPHPSPQNSYFKL